MTLPAGAIASEQSHRWEREAHEHYVEPTWCSVRLLEEEPFDGEVWDPACGFGNIVRAALGQRRMAYGSDIVARAPEFVGTEHNFLLTDNDYWCENIISNPPFDLFREFATTALRVATKKVALIWTVRTLPAAGSWLKSTPLAKILFLTPRPSMPPGHVISRGEKPGGGKQDFCWLIWDHALDGLQGCPEVGWLHRDKA